MDSYTFRYYHGQSMPFKTIEADNDTDFDDKLEAWERKSGFKHVPDTVICTTNRTRKVAERPARHTADV